MHDGVGHGLQRDLPEVAGQGVTVAVMVVGAVLFVRVHNLQAGGEGLGRLLEARQHPAALNAVPDTVVDRIGDGLEDRLDEADRQGDAPVARQDEGHQDGHDQVHETITRDLEGETPRGADQDANHYR
ncbi:hypothetical protein D3C77_428520 [compost metagenome]